MRIPTNPLSCSEIAAAVFLTEKEEGMVLYACKFAICWRASCECGRILWDHVSYTHLDTHPHPHAAGNSLITHTRSPLTPTEKRKSKDAVDWKSLVSPASAGTLAGDARR